MCSGGIFGGGGGSPSVVEAPTPTVAATAPPPENTAEAPVVNEGANAKATRPASARAPAPCASA